MADKTLWNAPPREVSPERERSRGDTLNESLKRAAQNYRTEKDDSEMKKYAENESISSFSIVLA